MNIKNINTGTLEGKMLFAALAILTCSPSLQIQKEEVNGQQTTPDEMLTLVFDAANAMDWSGGTPSLRNGYARIKRGKKKGTFSVSIKAAGNGEILQTTETLESHAACLTNILSQIRAFQSPGITVMDQSGEEEQFYFLNADGSGAPELIQDAEFEDQQPAPVKGIAGEQLSGDALDKIAQDAGITQNAPE